MSLPPVVTYASAPYTTAIEITITTTVLPAPIGMSSTLSSSATTIAILPEVDTTCSTTSSLTTLSTSFVPGLATSSAISPSTALTTDSSSPNTSSSSAVPASATLVVPTASSTPITLAAQTSRSNIGLPGTIGLSTALGIISVAVIAFFCYYRRKRKFHKEVMLIAPRLSKHTNHRSMETGEGTLIGSNLRSDSFQKDIKLGMLHPQLWPVEPVASRGAINPAYKTHPPRSLTPSSTRSRGVLGQEMTEQRPLGNKTYGIRYNTGGILTVEHDDVQEGHPENHANPLGWDEALEQLNTIHAASTLHRELSPPPLRIVKQTTPNPADQMQPPARTLLHPTHSGQESIPELDISDSPRDRDIERTRAAALAKLEGRYDRYATESVYSRTLDGISLHRPEGREGQRPQWRNLETHWPD